MDKSYIHFRVEDLGLSLRCSRQKMFADHLQYIIANVAKFAFNLCTHTVFNGRFSE